MSWLRHEQATAWMRDCLRGSAHGADLVLLGYPQDIQRVAFREWREKGWIAPIRWEPTISQRVLNFNQLKSCSFQAIQKYKDHFDEETTLSCHPDQYIWGPGPNASEVILPSREPLREGEVVAYTGMHARVINSFMSWRGKVLGSKTFGSGVLVTVEDLRTGDTFRILDVHLCRA